MTRNDDFSTLPKDGHTRLSFKDGVRYILDVATLIWWQQHPAERLHPDQIEGFAALENVEILRRFRFCCGARGENELGFCAAVWAFSNEEARTLVREALPLIDNGKDIRAPGIEYIEAYHRAPFLTAAHRDEQWTTEESTATATVDGQSADTEEVPSNQLLQTIKAALAALPQVRSVQTQDGMFPEVTVEMLNGSRYVADINYVPPPWKKEE